MGRCWTCGTKLSSDKDFSLSCSVCVEEKEKWEKISTELLKREESFLTAFSKISMAALKEVNQLRNSYTIIPSIVRCLIEELFENILEDVRIFNPVDLTTDSQTYAVARGLRLIGELKKAESLFLRLIETEDANCQNYIEIGKVYLQMGRIQEAVAFWETGINYTAKSGQRFDLYALVGRAYFCQENYRKAAEILKRSIKEGTLSYTNYYDYARYCALLGKRQDCLNAMKVVAKLQFEWFDMALKEKDFELFKKDLFSMFGKRYPLMKDMRILQYDMSKNARQFLSLFKKIDPEKEPKRIFDFSPLADEANNLLNRARNIEKMIDENELTTEAVYHLSKMISNLRADLQKQWEKTFEMFAR